MKIKIQVLIYFFVTSFINNAQAQIDSSSIKYNKQGTVSWATLIKPSIIPESNAINFLKDFLAKNNTDISFVLKSSSRDEFNIEHQKFEQTYKGLKVYFGEYFVHSKSGFIEFANGNYVDVSISNISPNLNEAQALTNALHNINAASYKWQNAATQAKLKQSLNDNNATYYPKGELMIVPKTFCNTNDDKLCYIFNVSTQSPSDNICIIIDAVSGTVIKKISLSCHYNVNGNAKTMYSGVQAIVCNNDLGTYKLEEYFSSGSKKIETNFDDILGNTNAFTNTTSIWDDTWANTQTKRAALDAHWGAEVTLKYWEVVHNLNNISPLKPNTPLENKIYDDSPWDGAVWEGDPFKHLVVYGLGDKYLSPLVSLDVCAHEIGHGICQYTAKLNPYSTIETNAISESLSDIWGACVENYANTPGSLSTPLPYKKAIWTSGEEIAIPYPNYVRSFQNPKLGLNLSNGQTIESPDCYLSNTWNTMLSTNPDPHLANGVMNKWFYILCQGETRTNEVGNYFTVTGINIDKAEKIVYKAERDYLTSTADFMNAREATIQAAKDLYPLDVSIEIAVTNAWYGVNVGDPYQVGSNCLITGTYTIINGFSKVYNGGTYYIPNNITVYSKVIFNDANIIMGANSTITIANGGNFTINGSHISTCSNMWKGIVVSNGGKLTISNSASNSSLIEDAQTAVNYNANNIAPLYSGKLISISNTIFNRNKVGIKIENYTNDANNQIIYPFSISNCIFTCRQILNSSGTWDNVSTVKGGVSPYPTPPFYTAPYINNTSYPDDNISSYLKDLFTIGYSIHKPEAGIILNNVNGINTAGIVIGDAANSNTNIFDNLQYGIKATETNLTVNNCTFQKPVDAGIGIDIINTNTNIVDISTPSGPNNAFFDMKTAINISQGKKILISNCDIRSTENHNKATNINELGRQGIYLSTSYYDKIDVLNNNIQNIRNGIVYSIFSEWARYFKVGDLSISNNHIGDNYLLASATQPTGGTFVQNAISLFAQLTSGGTSSSVSTQCDGNFIQAAYGIKATYFQGQSVQITNNYIKAIPSAFLAASNPELFGICLEGGSRDPFNDVIVQDNTVEGSANVGNNVAGILVSQQSDAQIGCNTVKTSSSGYKFTGFCPGTKFTDNFINSDNKNGVYLSKAIIGTQGNDGSQNANDFCPSNNSWTQDANWWKSTSPRQYMIYNDNSDPMLSEFVVRSGKFNPAGGGTAPLLIQNYDINIGVKLVSGFDGGQCFRCLGHPKRILNVQEMLDEIAAGTILLPNDEAQKRLEVMQQQLYELVKAQPELAANSTDIQQFIYDNQWQSLDFIYYLSYFAAKGKLDVVDNLLNYWLPTSSELDDNYRTYYEWLVAMYNNPDYTPNKDEVLALANKCPIKNGTIIYAVRNLYNALTKEIHKFEDDCDGIGQARGIKPEGGMIRLKQPKIKENITRALDKITLTPNPASSILKVVSNNINKIEVLNTLGVVVLQQNVNSSKQVELNISQLQKGFYLLRAIDINGKSSVDKFIKE